MAVYAFGDSHAHYLFARCPDTIGRLFVALIPPVRCPHCRRRFQLPSDLKVPR